MTKDLKFKINYMHDNSLRFSLCNDKMVDLWAIIKQNVIKNIITHVITHTQFLLIFKDTS